MRTLFTMISILAMTFAMGCSGGDGDGGGGDNTVDAGNGTPDAGGGTPDAGGGGGGTTPDGTACTPTMEDPTGGCGAGYLCLMGGGGGQCFEDCTNAMPGSACPLYDGPGFSACVFGLQDNMGNDVGSACGVICKDDTGMIPQCQNGECDGSCPGNWSCQPSSQQGISICQ